MQRTCISCNRIFNSKRNRSRCGRRKCNPARGSSATVCCEGCGESVNIPPSEVARFRFCSNSCAYSVRMIGNKYRVGHHSSTEFTRERVLGSANPNWKEPISRVCKYCSSVFYLKPWEINEKHAGVFCLRSCFISYKKEFESRENAPDWRGGNSSYRGSDWPVIRYRVIIEQCGHCWICDSFESLSLHVHHVVPYREFASSKEANIRSNLIGACASCHHMVEGMSWDSIISLRSLFMGGVLTTLEFV